MIIGSARSISAVVAFIGTLLGVVFVVWPSLRPESPPQTRRAQLDNVLLDRNVTFGQYLDRIEQSRRPYDIDQLARPGVLVKFDFVITGYRGDTLPLRWQLIDATSGDQLAQSRDLFIVPSAMTDQGTWTVWVESPIGRSRRLFVDLELYDRPGGVPLGRLRTPTFANT